MKGFGVGAAFAAASLFINTAVAATVAIDPIVIKGSKFFYKTNGTQFYIRGVAYQQDYTSTSTDTSTDYIDPLANATTCERDIPYLVALRTNTIRTYAIDPTADHDTCMEALAAAGIYVISDLSDPAESIDRNDPEWTETLYDRYASVIDALSGYNNTIGFFAGNEVSNSYNTTAASAFVKAAVRDMKAYIVAKGYRAMGVGYASDDDATIRDAESDYMNCGSTSSAIDFWGYNIYEWCGNSTFETSGYEARTEEFANYSVPVFFAEYGCNTVEPRTFGDTPVLFGPDMDQVWSGGIVYEYFQGTNDFGLVSIVDGAVSTLVDYSYYSVAIATVSPSGVTADSYTPTNSPRSCPATNSDWLAVATPLPPTPNEELCSCMYNSLSCVVSSSVSNSSYGTLFSTVCGLDASACDGINTNYTEGAYGAYGMCDTTEQLAFILNQYYVAQSSASSACDFSGSATIKSATSATGTCSSLLSQAGTAGTGTVTASPTVASGTGSTAASSSTGAATSGRMAGSPSSGTWQMTSLAVVAVLSAVGMILL